MNQDVPLVLRLEMDQDPSLTISEDQYWMLCLEFIECLLQHCFTFTLIVQHHYSIYQCTECCNTLSWSAAALFQKSFKTCLPQSKCATLVRHLMHCTATHWSTRASWRKKPLYKENCFCKNITFSNFNASK